MTQPTTLPLKTVLVGQLTAALEQFRRSTSHLHREIEDFKPVSDMMSVAQQIAHAAQVVDWFVQGASSPTGFDLDFAPQIAKVMAIRSLSDARLWFEQSMSGAVRFIDGLEEAQLIAPLPEGPVLGGMPRYSIVTAIAEHTSHHRGALAVFARVKGITPTDPYGV